MRHFGRAYLQLTQWLRRTLFAFAFAVPLLAPWGQVAAQDVDRSPNSAAVRGTFDHGLLWRIEKADTPASYLFGTIHLADNRATVLPPAVKAQLDAARSFTMEVALDAPNIA